MKNGKTLILVLIILAALGCKCQQDLFDSGAKPETNSEQTDSVNSDAPGGDSSENSAETLAKNPVDQLVEFCESGDYTSAAGHLINEDKCRNAPAPDQMHTCLADYTNPEEKQPVERSCSMIKNYALLDYKVSFQKTEVQKNITFYLYEVAAAEGKSLWVFTKINDKYVLADIDPVSAESQTPTADTLNENRSNMNVSP